MSPSSSRKQRASKACDFCRRRKLGCDNAEPECGHCRARNLDCTYASRARRARPSNARIQSLEAENVRLRQSLRGGSIPDGGGVAGMTPDSSNGQSGREVEGRSPLAATPLVSRSCSGLETPTFQETTFHGPSSTMSGRATEAGSGNQSDDQIKDQLLAGATRQRQLESVNMRSGKLDLDGTDPDLAAELLSNFWSRQHFAGSTVHRPAFTRDMAACPAGPYFSPLLLNAMLFAGSKHSDHRGARDDGTNTDSVGRPFRRKFDALLRGDPGVLFASRITTIQALLIVADALFSWCDERSLSWHYTGLAIGMIVDLGLHTESGWSGLSPLDVEVRRRVFWAAFALDKVQAIYQGRPARLREADNNVQIKFLDEYEELEPFHTRTYSPSPRQLDVPTYSVTTFEQLSRLSVIMDRVLACLYAERSFARDADELLLDAGRLHGELERWKRDLPAHLVVRLDDAATSTILPHTLSLTAMYNSLIILLHRPFVSDGHLQSASETTARAAFAKCAAAASEINRLLHIYRQNFCLGTVPYFVSYATGGEDEEEQEREGEQEEDVPRGGDGDLDGEAPIDFDALMGDVDMEEILRSFDAPPPPPPAAQTDGTARPAWDADPPGAETWVPGAQDQVLYYPDSLFGFGLWSA
ncbi:hypothetical protein N3K66_004069 [Trichothecium roseum]|uniref:Uncharacterized protein n=1 Tax=Trichothecium roseum TaxID=47278 RepID=A0ACC0V909_9HYPO|nr:hypothetical protein N3K66_004069 [Trichothecium roseum]